MQWNRRTYEAVVKANYNAIAFFDKTITPESNFITNVFKEVSRELQDGNKDDLLMFVAPYHDDQLP